NHRQDRGRCRHLAGQGSLRGGRCGNHQPGRSRPKARPRNQETRRGARQTAAAGAGSLPQGRAARDRQLRLGAAPLRYFLDTEYNGWGGALLSLALVPDEGDELYLTLDWSGALDPWVEKNVTPYLDMVSDTLVSPRLTRADAARTMAHYLAGDAEPLIVADWPEDVALFNALVVTGPGVMAEVPEITFRVVQLPGFSTAANSKVPHNALHDARALRDHIVGME